MTERTRLPRTTSPSGPGACSPPHPMYGPASGIHELQRAAGNRATARLLGPDAPVVQRWRDFEGAAGRPMYDYKLVDGAADGHPYHLKFHNVEQLGVFDEIHIVFEEYDPKPHFYYRDDGTLIPSKSQAATKTHPELRALADQLVHAQLQTSPVTPSEVVEEKRRARAQQAAKDQAVKQENERQSAERGAAAVAKEQAARVASQASPEEETHLGNLLTDCGHGAGELPAVMAYLRGEGQARSHWKTQVDWYRKQRDARWQVRLDSIRKTKKAAKVTADQVRGQHRLPESVGIRVEAKNQGSATFYTPVLDYRNYTTYRAAGGALPT